ncbi:probable carboxylesterase 12 [Andrographis paniculata]|uniref:probable carboxylesterase 12 n=1 Tax=Andrographis paniculata TaxID=175694 RepID=UPI0021E77508|nr:probable carboxylesterase 12 [Andrographis paniculata]
MDSLPANIILNVPPFFRLHASGHVERYREHDFVPPSTDPQNGVVSRDAVVSPENNLAVRLYLPKSKAAGKLPLLIYIHGGGFSTQSAFSSVYHPYANSLAADSNSVVVSIDYRLAPEHPLPACYDDSYAAVKWVGSHSRVGPDPWLNEYADFERVYIAGDSAGANIAHDVVVRSAGGSSSPAESLGLKFSGLILIHPFFGSGEPTKVWDFIYPGSTGPTEFRLIPAADPARLSRLSCERVMVVVAEKDYLRDRGQRYYEALKSSHWKGSVELFETPGEHVFHLFNPTSENAISIMNRVSQFVNARPRPKSRF